MPKDYDIMVAGHLCLDIIPLFHQVRINNIADIMCPGKLVNIREVNISTGGPVSNTGLNMKMLGLNVCFCSCIGDDLFGKIILDMLIKSGNTDGIKILEGQASSYTVVVAPPGIDRIFLHNPGTNDHFGPENLDSDLIKKCRHFHFGYPPLMEKMFADEGKVLAEIFRIAKEAGATTSCDMTLPDPDSNSGKAPWRKILKNVLPYVDIHVPSFEETFYMLHPQEFMKMKSEHNNAELIDHFTPEDYSKIADEILSMGCKMTTLKSGHRGFYVKTCNEENFASFGAAKPANPDNWSDREVWTAAYEVGSFGSATGSGDSSIAGFLSAFLRGLSIEQAVKYATCCGLQNVQVLDAVSGIKPWEETTKMIEDSMSMIDINLDGSNWSYSEDYKLWSGPNDPLSQEET